MVKEPVGGGGNLLTDPTISIKRVAAIGDVVASLVVVDKLIERGFKVEFQAHTDIHCVLRRHGGISRIAPPGNAVVNLDNCYEDHPQRAIRHFSDLFLEAANRQLMKRNINLGEPLNCTPRLRTQPHVKAAAIAKFKDYPKPWVFICPRSQAFFARTVPDPVWMEAARKIEGTKFWIGMHPAPPGIVDLQCKHFDNVIDWLSAADVLVTVDTGPMHVAAALGIPVVAIEQASSPELHLSDQRDFIMIPCALECHNCQQNGCPKNYHVPPCQSVDPQLIADTVNRRLRSIYSQDVSAVIAVYKPEAATLNRCLECVLPQVDEVIVTAAADAIIPAAAMQHPKIKYVRKNKAKIGYSGNMNFGGRHSNGKYLLIINDDVFVHPGSVAKLKECMTEKVGMVSGLLYYGDGKKIYHAGKVRRPGERGWGHIDHMQENHTFRDVTELENVNGAFILADRKAFYDAGCQDEEMPIFANDDALSLSMRQKGYRVLFTPHARGIHLEHQSIGKLDTIPNLLNEANRVFNRKWGWYLEKNLYQVPGVFQ